MGLDPASLLAMFGQGAATATGSGLVKGAFDRTAMHEANLAMSKQQSGYTADNSILSSLGSGGSGNLDNLISGITQNKDQDLEGLLKMLGQGNNGNTLQ